MSYRIYTTLGFIIGSRPYGEGGKILFIFTQELGQISALAQGIRLAKSKLRYHAQDYSFANFSLVRGKDFWRVIGAEAVLHDMAEEKVDMFCLTSTPAYALRVRMLSLLSRLLQGEEKNEPLFDTVVATYKFLENSEVEKYLTSVEPIIMLRIMHHLGYVRSTPDFKVLVNDNLFSPVLFEYLALPGIKAKVIKEVNTALQESHL